MRLMISHAKPLMLSLVPTRIYCPADARHNPKRVINRANGPTLYADWYWRYVPRIMCWCQVIFKSTSFKPWSTNMIRISKVLLCKGNDRSRNAQQTTAHLCPAVWYYFLQSYHGRKWKLLVCANRSCTVHVWVQSKIYCDLKCQYCFTNILIQHD